MNKILWWAAVLFFSSLFGGCGGGNSNPTPNPIPAPTPSPAPPTPVGLPPARRGMKFTFFGDDATLSETFPHVNAVFIASWANWATERQLVIDRHIRQLQAAKIAGINYAFLTLDFLLFVPNQTYPRKYLGSDAAIAGVTDYFRQLRAAGLLDMEFCIYPCDEPDIAENNLPIEVSEQYCTDIRIAMDKFPELAKTTFGVIYSNTGDYRALHKYDKVGMDDYPQDVGVLLPDGKFDRLLQQLNPNQTAILVVGCCDPYRIDPVPFYEYALAHPQIESIVIFIYISPYGDGKYKGVRDNGMAPVCFAIGDEIKRAQNDTI